MKEWKRLALLTKEKDYNHKKDKKIKKFEKKYGFDYRETWNLDYEIACFILPRLAYLREHSHSYPGTDEFLVEGGHEKWLKIIDKMIKAFEIIVDKDCGFETEEENEIIEEGLDLFRKYFRTLWD